jgi:hypothetical protein
LIFVPFPAEAGLGSMKLLILGAGSV